jgi:hypothetical protein
MIFFFLRSHLGFSEAAAMKIVEMLRALALLVRISDCISSLRRLIY